MRPPPGISSPAWEGRRATRAGRHSGASFWRRSLVRRRARAPGCSTFGCSTGDYLDRAQARAWAVHGIELAQHLAVFARVKRGLPVEHGGVDDVVHRFGTEAFNAITLWDVIEHLPKPLDALRSLYRALEPGGTLYLSTPNLAGWVPRFHWRVLRPLTGIWPHPEPPLHLHQFTALTVARLFAAAGSSGCASCPMRSHSGIRADFSASRSLGIGCGASRAPGERARST